MSAAHDEQGLRVPPHSVEAEEAVIGALLLDNAAFETLAGMLKPGDFYAPDRAAMFGTIARLIGDGKVADILTVHDAGGHELAYLNGCARSVPSARNVLQYARIVRERAVERGLVVAGDELASSAWDGSRSVEQRIDAAMAALTALAGVRAQREPVALHDALVDWIDRLSAEADGNTKVLQTGIAALDRLLNGGLREGELIVIGARPKMGKTALALTLARNMAHRYGALVLSQEMPVSQLIARDVAAMGQVQLSDLRDPARLSEDGWARVSEAVDRMRDRRLMLDDQRALTLADVRRKVMQAKRRQAVDVVVIDFLQLMAGADGEGENRNQELDRISNGLKAMAGEFGCAVVLLSQLSREADKRRGPPVMTDLRDSGAIEAAADVIALLYREFAHPLGDHTEEWRNHAQLEIVQRNGAPGSVDLRWSGEYQQFSDWDGPPPWRRGSAARTKTAGA